MKQPHEDIIGIERDPEDYLLTLHGKEALTAIFPALFNSMLQGATRSGGRHEAFERLHDPQVGARVFVQDTMYRKELSHEGSGYLVEHRAEFGTTDEVWERESAVEPTLTAEDRYIERDVWYIQYGPKAVDVCRWTNCRVLAIPTRPESEPPALGAVLRGL